MKKILCLALILILTLSLSTHVFASESISSSSEKKTDETMMIMSPPGNLLDSSSANFWYSTNVTLTVPSGRTAHHIGVQIYGTDNTTNNSVKFSIYCAGSLTSQTVPADGNWHYFNIIALSGGNSKIYTISYSEGTITKQYHANVSLYT